jgi:hypothetical protein
LRATAISLLVIAALVVGGVAILGTDERSIARPSPTTTPFADDAAGFAVRYPAYWRIVERTPGVGLRFVTDDDASKTTGVRILSVIVQPAVAELPALEALSAELTARLRTLKPDIELDATHHTTLLGSRALVLDFVDRNPPATKTREIVTRTRRGQLLVVTITGPRETTSRERRALAVFLASLAPSPDPS